MQLLGALAAFASVISTTAAHPHVASHEMMGDVESTLVPRQAGIAPARCRPGQGVHIVVSSGHGAPDVGGYGLLSTTVMAVKAQVGGNNVSTVFDKQNPSWPVGIVNGVGNLTEHLNWYISSCPDTPIVLMGYSQGAIVTMNTLCGRSVANSPWGTSSIPSDYAKNIIATVIYGDETRAAGQPYNYGTCTIGNGSLQRQNPAGCGVFASNIRSWCDENDPQCCVGGPAPNQDIHYVYPAEYDADAVAFVKERYTPFVQARRAARKVGRSFP